MQSQGLDLTIVRKMLNQEEGEKYLANSAVIENKPSVLASDSYESRVTANESYIQNNQPTVKVEASWEKPATIVLPPAGISAGTRIREVQTGHAADKIIWRIG